MICLRCGYCCKNYLVPVIDNPELGLIASNIIVNEGYGDPCKHLKGDKPGEYICDIHDCDFYEKTPCYGHTQIERGNTNCRTGEYMLKKLKNGK